METPFYTIHIKKNRNEYVAYCNELGRGSCYGMGESPQEALLHFLRDQKKFVKLLKQIGKPIPEPED